MPGRANSEVGAPGLTGPDGSVGLPGYPGLPGLEGGFGETGYPGVPASYCASDCGVSEIVAPMVMGDVSITSGISHVNYKNEYFRKRFKGK
uniref:Collagen triple helix repeat protein n=2 Tax=Bursaphelenchus xylophilus TaxID=6326 RepID=A0A1I7SBA9_BURXY